MRYADDVFRYLTVNFDTFKNYANELRECLNKTFCGILQAQMFATITPKIVHFR